MKNGQKVRISVDALPDRKFIGRIVAISDATGSSMSLLPQDNSAGILSRSEQRYPGQD